MKKLLIILIIIISYLWFSKDSFIEQAKKEIGIESISNIQVIEKGSDKNSRTDYVIFKINNKNILSTIIKNYQEISSFNSQGNNPNLLKVFKYFDKNKKYYEKDINLEEKNVEIFIQKNIIIYTVDYTGLF